MSDIKLWLDSYDDIYSDFDSRHYLKRRISEDFLYELRNELAFTKTEVNHIILLLPQNKRNAVSEEIIAKGLSDYFKTQYIFHKKKCENKLKQGLLLFFIGCIIMLLNSFFSFTYKESFLIIFLRILLEPAGWFLLWAAFDFLYYDFAKLKTVRNSFQLLSNVEIKFNTSE
jgi:hypothetical protein